MQSKSTSTLTKKTTTKKQPRKRRLILSEVVAGIIVLLGVTWLAATFLPEPVMSVLRFGGRAGDETFSAELSGFAEVPAVLTNGEGEFQATLAANGRSLNYELTYADLTEPATEAHLHFAQEGVNGPVFAFLCGGGGKPDCPGTGGTVRGSVDAGDILAIQDQGLDAGDFEGALRIIRAETSYVNVHSTRFPPGEIRGQVR